MIDLILAVLAVCISGILVYLVLDNLVFGESYHPDEDKYNL